MNLPCRIFRGVFFLYIGKIPAIAVLCNYGKSFVVIVEKFQWGSGEIKKIVEEEIKMFRK